MSDHPVPECPECACELVTCDCGRETYCSGCGWREDEDAPECDCWDDRGDE